MVHLFNPLWDGTGGSEWRTLSLFSLLAEHTEVAVWTEYPPDPVLLGQYPIREMLQLQQFPRGGTFVFVGAYWEIGRWVAQARPDRVILVYNVVCPSDLEKRIAQLLEYGVDHVELVFSSELAAAAANGRLGVIESSPVDLDSFSAAEYGSRFVVGRHSRDQAFKHHPEDPALYRRLAEAGVPVRIMGGTSLGEVGANVEILPASAEPVPQFLPSIDCFYYRTSPAWTETYGRVVVEAMACGLPCVLESRHGYRELIEHGVNGFFFETADEAYDSILRLQSDLDLRRAVGEAARASVQARYEEANRKTVEFYTR